MCTLVLSCIPFCSRVYPIINVYTLLLKCALFYCSRLLPCALVYMYVYPPCIKSSRSICVITISGHACTLLLMYTPSYLSVHSGVAVFTLLLTCAPVCMRVYPLDITGPGSVCVCSNSGHACTLLLKSTPSYCSVYSFIAMATLLPTYAPFYSREHYFINVFTFLERAQFCTYVCSST